MSTPEQQARDLMEQCGVEDAQSFSAGDVVALANFISDANDFRDAVEEIRHISTSYTPSPDVVADIAEIAAQAIDNSHAARIGRRFHGVTDGSEQ